MSSPDTTTDADRLYDSREIDTCRKCGVRLREGGEGDGGNWSPSCASNFNYICQECHSQQVSEAYERRKAKALATGEPVPYPPGHCRKCGEKLVESENWHRSRALRNDRICKACVKRLYDHHSRSDRPREGPAKARKYPDRNCKNCGKPLHHVSRLRETTGDDEREFWKRHAEWDRVMCWYCDKATKRLRYFERLLRPRSREFRYLLMSPEFDGNRDALIKQARRGIEMFKELLDSRRDLFRVAPELDEKDDPGIKLMGGLPAIPHDQGDETNARDDEPVNEF